MIEWLKRSFHPKRILIVASVISAVSLLFAYLSPFIHPATIGFLPFFGLGYWIILVFNLLFLIIWCFVRLRYALLILLILLLGGKLHFRMFTIGGGDINTGQQEIKVMSYNVRLFDLYHANRNNDFVTKDKIFSYIKQRDPDILCFQEFFRQDEPTDFVTRDSIIKLMGYVDYHERYTHRQNARQNFGIALFSRFPIIEKGFVNFHDQDHSFNYCIYADIVKEDTFRVYDLHLQSIHLQQDDYALFNINDEDASNQSSTFFKLLSKVYKAYPIRANQAEIVAEHINHSPYPVVLCGDFNDTPLSYSYNMFNGELIDAFRNTSLGIGSTYTGKIPAGRIDYIFHSPSLGSYDFNIQKEILSDHYAIDCKIFKKP